MENSSIASKILHNPINASKSRQMLNKVPEVTIFFWIIKVLCTTVGETASDFLNVNLGFGLIGTSIVAGILLLVVLFFQFRAKRYIPGIYWLAVVLISIFGTLVTDNMTDGMGIPLEVSTIGFSIALMITFAIWYAFEKTLSIHSIHTTRREVFYWLTILFTFALGTAAGDLMAESLGLGYLVTGIIVIAVVVCVSVAWKLKLDPILSFWIVYVMTRPLGASLGDYLSQPQKFGGLGLGATITSAIFIGAILLTVIFLAITKWDTKARKPAKAITHKGRFAVVYQVIAVIGILVIAGGTGYYFRHNQLMNDAGSSAQASLQPSNSVAQATSPGKGSSSGSQAIQGNTSTSTAQAAGKPSGTPAPTSKLGDLSSFIKIEEDTLSLVNAGNLSAAASRIDDLEYTWDQAEASLKPKDPSKWTEIDKTLDNVFRQLRAVTPKAASCKSALESSLAAFQS